MNESFIMLVFEIVDYLILIQRLKNETVLFYFRYAKMTEKKSFNNFKKKKSYSVNSSSKSKNYSSSKFSNDNNKSNAKNSWSKNRSGDNSNPIFKDRYDKFFGIGTFNKLIEAKNLYSNDSFIRVNLSKTTIEEVEEFLKKNRVKYSKTFLPNAFKIEKSFFNLSSTFFAISSKIYLQDLASQIPVNVIDFEKLKSKFENRVIRVLDMAASPGSKTTQIADLLNFHGIAYEIVALEPEVKRLTKLINNIQKHGFSNVEVINKTGQGYISSEKFDIVLLDAPCSGNLVGDKGWLSKRDIKGVSSKSKVQKELIEKAKSLVKNDGEIVYSTCSLEVEENEENVVWAQEKCGLKLKSVSSINFPFKTFFNINNKSFSQKMVSSCVRVMPYLSKTQGFFVAKFVK